MPTPTASQSATNDKQDAAAPAKPASNDANAAPAADHDRRSTDREPKAERRQATSSRTGSPTGAADAKGATRVSLTGVALTVDDSDQAAEPDDANKTNAETTDNTAETAAVKKPEPPPPPSSEDRIRSQVDPPMATRKPDDTTNYTLTDSLTETTSDATGASDTETRSGLARLGFGPGPVGGISSFVDPESRVGVWWKERERLQALRRDGFVALRPAREKRIHRILPRTVIGIATMLLMLGVGAAFSGAAFYAYYDSRLADNERAVARFVDGFDQQFSDATGAIDSLRTETITEIRDEMAPFRVYATEANAVVGLPADVGPSVWLLETLDEDGELAVGAAFAVIGHEGGTAMLTSYSLVANSTVEPSPGIDLIKDRRRIPAQLWSWDADNDVALLVVDEVIEPIEIAGDADQVDAVGARLFAMSGVGGQGASASPGVLIDHSSMGLQHTVPIGAMFRGGPLVTSEGKMLGLASLDFAPLGIDGGEVRHGPDMRTVCLVVLECSRIREEVVVEVAEAELQAPVSDGESVRSRADVVDDDAVDDDAVDDAVDDDADSVEEEAGGRVADSGRVADGEQSAIVSQEVEVGDSEEAAG